MPWIILGVVLLGTFLAAYYLAPKPKLENARPAALSEFSVPRADEGDPVPIVYGTTRLRSPNTLWYGDYAAKAVKQKVKTGIFSSKRITKGFKYYLGLHLGLCLGTGNLRIRRIWAGKYTIWTGDESDVEIFIDKPELFGGTDSRGGMKGNVIFYSGAFSQVQDPYLLQVLGSDVPRYGGICHIVFRAFYFGMTPSLEALNFELQQLTDELGTGKGTMPNGLDANPAEILYDLVTATWGRLGLDPSNIDIASWQAVAEVLYDEELGLSLVVSSANSGRDIVEEVLRHIDGLMYQDPKTGKIKLKLVRSDYVEADLLQLDISNVKELIAFQKTTWEGTFNEVRLTFPNRDRDYEDGVYLTQDMANINFQGKVKSSNFAMPLISDPDVANRVAARTLAMMSVPLYRVELVCSRIAAGLRPGDVFKLSWEPYGLINLVLRVQKIDYGDLTSGSVRISAIQDKFATASTLFATPAPTLWIEPVKTPLPVTDRFFIQSPPFIQLASGFNLDHHRLYVLAKPPGANSVAFSCLGAEVDWANGVIQVLDNPASYENTATLVNALAAGTGAALGYLASVDIENVRNPEDLVDAAGLSDIRDGRSLMIIGNEFFMYRTFTDNLDGTYTLTDVYRGLLDSGMEDHLAGDTVWFIDGQEDQLDIAINSLSPGHPWKFKLLDVTPLGTLDEGSALEDVVYATEGSRYTMPAPPDYTRVDGNRTGTTFARGGSANLTVSWRERNRNATEIRVVDDAGDTQEAGVLYRMRYRFNGGSWTTVTALAAPSTTISDPGLTTGTLEVELDSYLTGPVYSWSRDYLSVTLT